MTRRELKFRAWDPDKKEMLYDGFPDNLILFKNNIFVEIITLNPNSLRVENRGNLVPMQYTGLKDMHGMEIYEGDILRKRNNGFTYYISDKLETSCGCFSTVHGWFIFYPDEEEVIGNIYKNPEFLENHEE